MPPYEKGDRCGKTHENSVPTFEEVKVILDFLVRERTDNLEFLHGERFGWAALAELREAVAKPRGSSREYRLIDPEMVGNARAEETNLIRVLRGTLEGISRMPLDGDINGDFATDEQIETIVRWIDADMPE